MESLQAFPATSALPAFSASMLAQDVGLRAADASDLPYLRALFHAAKTEQLGLAAWPEPLRQTLLDQQFALQHTQYLRAYAKANFWIVQCRGKPIGRYYVSCEQPCFHVIDILLETVWRGRGIGSTLLQWTQSIAYQHGAQGIGLHVDDTNEAAQRLYARLDFARISHEPPHVVMRWDPSTRST
jgi:GNAT superfamily N-acetyltransferase